MSEKTDLPIAKPIKQQCMFHKSIFSERCCIHLMPTFTSRPRKPATFTCPLHSLGGCIVVWFFVCCSFCCCPTWYFASSASVTPSPISSTARTAFGRVCTSWNVQCILLPECANPLYLYTRNFMDNPAIQLLSWLQAFHPHRIASFRPKDDRIGFSANERTDECPLVEDELIAPLVESLGRGKPVRLQQ